jgi:hypothetical protein
MRNWARTAGVAANAELVSGVGNASHLGVIEGMMEAAVRVLGIAQQIAAALDHARRDAGRLESLHHRAGLA